MVAPPARAIARVSGGNLALVGQLLERGAEDVLREHPEPEYVVALVRRAMDRRRLERSVARRSAARRGGAAFHGIVGRSDAMVQLRARIERAARSDASVLIRGESGTGKELVAQAIHRLSRRSCRPLVVIQCATVPDALAASELFGHERGAFTDARTARRGRFEAADGGTVFLDEVGDLSATVQVQLLRTLQFGEIARVGSDRPAQVDVRVVAATHRPLEELVAAGEFRGDLFYRLNELPITIPPLRERRSDVPLLARELLKRANRIEGRAIPGITPRAIRALIEHEWPGNVRELEHRLRRAVVELEDDRPIEADDLEVEAPSTEPLAEEPASGLDRTLVDAETTAIVRALEATRGNRTHAAAELGISRRTLQKKMVRLGIR